MNGVMISGNPSQYTGLVHAAVPEHAVVAGGSFGACGGGDALPTRPVQVGTTATTSTTHTHLLPGRALQVTTVTNPAPSKQPGLRRSCEPAEGAGPMSLTSD